MTDSPRLAVLRAKLAARKGKPGFEANCRAIEAEIATLESAQTTEGEPK